MYMKCCYKSFSLALITDPYHNTTHVKSCRPAANVVFSGTVTLGHLVDTCELCMHCCIVPARGF